VPIDIHAFRSCQPEAKLEYLYSELIRIEALIPKTSRRGGKKSEKKLSSTTSSDSQPTNSQSSRPPYSKHSEASARE